MYKEPAEMPLQMLLHQVQHMNMQHIMYLFEQYDLKPGQAGILFALEHNGDLSQREIAKIIGVTPPSITVAIKKMEKNGFLTRKADEKDQRITRIQLTDKGRECVVDIKSVSKKMDEILFRGMNAEEKIILRRLLMQIRDNLREDKTVRCKKGCPHI